jgi:hypothetical protein
MGRSRRQRKSNDELFSSMSIMLIPEFILKDFEVSDIKKFKNDWVIELEEKQDRIPEELRPYQDMIFDGFSHPIDILRHSFSLKPVYLRVFRRRWKRSNTDKHHKITVSPQLERSEIPMSPE